MSEVEASFEQHDRFVYVSARDPLTQPLFDELAYEYSSRYAAYIPVEELDKELVRYPVEAFAPPQGAFLLLLREGRAIAGGAFMRHHTPATAEFKRIWVSRAHRRQGLARRVLAELEAQAARQGYTRVHLGTGPRQPEAVGLYRSSGYTLLSSHDFGEDAPPGVLFEKYLLPVHLAHASRAD
ncbi:GNAT family N-acetyltransferase [Burkholderia cenocepacia]|uniref:GNAT family N-acetyltransferase n=1 Tax=Burkholderia cepacia complex TaxID=87882 RepID=UPI000F59BAAB|nr:MULTISPECIES: GNAT family N-acetyltransferase [Burkholderia cepacia complex]ELW9447101.1 GNAT family N-acetyltransferase [Burkholderia cenocepacia]MBN3566195.1 GNAT family N-acetyltransferase [Burkholderia cenocepacia]MBR7958675.1 GNAT family N-acetyltransferase [Burkholderia cenocepacia]MBR8109658.1 GNAT family N-acetyltransferase [Burkholderia cenocepacia]MBR8198542.1 GNAT family N-acetyltransferase [Burkholderia cenocepacia]